MTNIDLFLLADRPHHTEACAAWAYGRWGVRTAQGSLTRALSRMKDGAQRGGLPLTVVAEDTSTQLPVGMGSLWTQDGDEWPDKTPWIAAVFTHYRYRGQGVAQKIIARLEQEARRLGYPAIYLHSGSAAGMYRKLGYDELETIPSPTSRTGHLTLFHKPLTLSP